MVKLKTFGRMHGHKSQFGSVVILLIILVGEQRHFAQESTHADIVGVDARPLNIFFQSAEQLIEVFVLGYLFRHCRLSILHKQTRAVEDVSTQVISINLFSLSLKLLHHIGKGLELGRGALVDVQRHSRRVSHNLPH